MAVSLLLVFMGLAAIVLVTVALGLKISEDLRNRQVAGMLRTVSGDTAQEVTTTLLRSAEDNAGPTALMALPFAGPWQRMIQQAGMKWTVSQLALMILCSAAAGALAGLKVRVLIDPYLSMLALMLLFGSLPYLHVARRRTKRMKAFEAQFSDALEFLARSMRAGHAFSVSLEMLGEEMPDPMCVEFRQVFTEQNFGMSLESALKNLHMRVPSMDVGFFVSAIMLQKETGGNLAEILTKLAYIIRERFRLKMKVRTASAHGRFTGTVLTIMPLVLIMALSAIVPGYLPSMLNDPLGKYLVAGAVVSQMVGYFFIRKIVAIKV